MNRTIFCDLDGVLADFDFGFYIVMGIQPKEANKEQFKEFWNQVCVGPDFWSNLTQMHDFEILWDFIKVYKPIILTGCPYSGKHHATKGKKHWCSKYLGSDIEVIATMSNMKQKFMKSKGDILIDDNADNCRRWTEAGGVAILHTNSKDTIENLKNILNGD